MFSAVTLNLLTIIKLIMTKTELLTYTGLINPNVEKRGTYPELYTSL